MGTKGRPLTLVLIFAMLSVACTHQGVRTTEEISMDLLSQTPRSQESLLKLTSAAFKNSEVIPKRYTCDGENMNPPLSIEGTKKGTQSLVLIVDDPDAPTGTWVHWLVWNIPPQFTEIPENSVPPSALQGTNDFGKEEWGGPCPPPGPEHRYFLRLYALDALLELQRGANKSLLEKAMEGHILDQTELIGRYARGR